MVRKKGSKKEHDRIVADTLILLGREANKICRAFSNPTGVAYRDYVWGREWIEYGVKGSGDIYGFLFGGKAFYIEIKSGEATQQENQESFEAMCKKFGVHYFVCRSADEALNCILRAAAL